MKRGASAALATLGTALAAAAHAQAVVTITLPAQSAAPAWTTLPDGRLQLALPGGSLVVDAAATAGKSAPLAAAPSANAATAGGAAPAANEAAKPSTKSQIVAALNKELAPRTQAALDNFNNYAVDMSVPTSPAFAVLGSTPETILQPKSPRDLAVSLVQALSDDGKLGHGVGFDVTPYLMLRGKTATLAKYQDGGAGLRLWANTQFSFAAIKQDASGRAVTKAAAGASVVLYDAGDPRAKDSPLASCFSQATQQDIGVGTAHVPDWVRDAMKGQQLGDATPPPTMVDAANQLSADFDDCRSQFKKATWNSTRWTAGLGQAFHDGGGPHTGATGLWTTFSLNLDGDDGQPLKARADDARAQALFHYRHTNREEVASDTDPRGYALRRSDLLALGAKYGSDKRNFSAEASWQRGRYDTGAHEAVRKLALGGELMVTKDLWLVLSIGGKGGEKNGSNTPFVLGGLKLGSASEPTGVFAP